MNNANNANENVLSYKKTSPYGENREKEKEREKEANGEIDHSPKNLYQVCISWNIMCELHFLLHSIHTGAFFKMLIAATSL